MQTVTELINFRGRPGHKAKLARLANQLGVRPSDVLRALIDRAEVAQVKSITFGQKNSDADGLGGHSITIR